MILRRGRKWRPRSGQFPFFCIPDKPVFFCGSSIGAGLQAPAPGTLSESFFTLLPQSKISGSCVDFEREGETVIGVVGMWESGAVGEIPKKRGKQWETCLWFSTLSTAASFPQLSCPAAFTRTAAAPATRSCTAAAAWPSPRSSSGRTGCRSWPPPAGPTAPS